MGDRDTIRGRVVSPPGHNATGAVVPVRYEQCGIDVGACAAEQGVTSEQIGFTHRATLGRCSSSRPPR